MFYSLGLAGKPCCWLSWLFYIFFCAELTKMQNASTIYCILHVFMLLYQFSSCESLFHGLLTFSSQFFDLIC